MPLSKLQNEDVPFPKWQLVAAFAGVAIFSAGIYYYIVRNSSKKSDGTKKFDETKKEVKKQVKKQEPEEITEPIDVLKLEPEAQAKHYKLQGNEHYKSGKYEEAIEYYDKAINVCPAFREMDLATYYQNRAATYEQMKNWEAVMSDCSKALTYNDKYIKAFTRRARACEILEDLDQSLEDLTAVCILEAFNNESTLLTIDRVLKKVGKEHAKLEMENKVPINPSKYFVKAYFDSFTQDPIMKKESSSNGSVEKENEPLRKNLYHEAQEHLAKYNLEKVIECCTTELSNPLSNMRPLCLLMRATMYILRGENKDAFADLNEIIDKEEHFLKIRVNALIKRGILHMQHEDIEDALKDLKVALDLDPENADIYHHKGQILLLIIKVDEAMADFQRAVDLDSNFPVAMVQKTYTDFRYAHERNDYGKIEQVKKDFENISEKFPECSESYMLHAQILIEVGDFEKAHKVYDKLEKLDKKNPNTYVHRAMLHLQTDGQPDEARTLINEAIKLDDTCQLAFENLATIEVQLGNLQSGIDLFDKAIRLAKTGIELTHLCSLRDAAIAQVKVVKRMGIILPGAEMA